VDEEELRETITHVGPSAAAVATVFGCHLKDGEVRSKPTPAPGNEARIAAR
jgi:hypothetical protein